MGTEVTIVEFLPNLVPLEDEDVSKQFERSFKKAGIKVMTNSSVEKLDTSGKLVKATVKTMVESNLIIFQHLVYADHKIDNQDKSLMN